ncbi:MAG TPA: hypothetical protein VGH21_04490 [Solirubrobacteraceae bacterium]
MGPSGAAAAADGSGFAAIWLTRSAGLAAGSGAGTLGATLPTSGASTEIVGGCRPELGG